MRRKMTLTIALAGVFALGMAPGAPAGDFHFSIGLGSYYHPPVTYSTHHFTYHPAPISHWGTPPGHFYPRRSHWVTHDYPRVRTSYSFGHGHGPQCGCSRCAPPHRRDRRHRRRSHWD